MNEDTARFFAYGEGTSRIRAEKTIITGIYLSRNFTEMEQTGAQYPLDLSVLKLFVYLELKESGTR